jgi:hypothetical protein
MTIEQAALALQDRLKDTPWFTAAGIGDCDREPCIFLYVKSTPYAALHLAKEGWQGFPVEIRKMGTPRMAGMPEDISPEQR